MGMHTSRTAMARTPKPPPITVDYREKPCGFMLGGVMPCKLSPKHRGPHDPAPIPPVFDYNPADWAIHARRSERGTEDR
jgi:hypothetical protein